MSLKPTKIGFISCLFTGNVYFEIRIKKVEFPFFLAIYRKKNLLLITKRHDFFFTIVIEPNIRIVIARKAADTIPTVAMSVLSHQILLKIIFHLHLV